MGVWWQHLLLFLAVAASWIGLPMLGTVALGAAAVAASQGRLDLAGVIVTAIVASEVGGLIGYTIGNRWGRQLLERPGRRQAQWQRMVERGERIYQTWGRVAVFFTPAVVSGTAKMQPRQFAVWNFIDAVGWTLAVGSGAYGIGRLASGHTSAKDVAILVLGLALGISITYAGVRVHRRWKARGPRDVPTPTTDRGSRDRT
jgi:membrane-associated protein